MSIPRFSKCGDKANKQLEEKYSTRIKHLIEKELNHKVKNG